MHGTAETIARCDNQEWNSKQNQGRPDLWQSCLILQMCILKELAGLLEHF
jgi:hypothetical protein